MYLYESENKQMGQKICMDEQGAPDKTQTD